MELHCFLFTFPPSHTPFRSHLLPRTLLCFVPREEEHRGEKEKKPVKKSEEEKFPINGTVQILWTHRLHSASQQQLLITDINEGDILKLCYNFVFSTMAALRTVFKLYGFYRSLPQSRSAFKTSTNPLQRVRSSPLLCPK